MLMINDVLNEEVISLYTTNSLWSIELRGYLSSIAYSINTAITIEYSGLVALNTYESIIDKPNAISQYLYDSTSNEIERIYKALTSEYNPINNYHRTINEKNTGSNNNIYSGTDIEKTNGTDTTNVKDDLIINNTVKNDSTTVSENTYDSANVNGLRPTGKSESEYSDTNEYDGTTDTTVTYGKSIDTTYGRNLEMKFGRNVDTEIDGTNGIFPYQDLISKEYNLRIKKRLFETVIYFLISKVSSGVWHSTNIDGE